MKFNLEKNLDHQIQAVSSTVNVFDGLETISKTNVSELLFINPIFNKDLNFKYVNNLGNIQEQNGIERKINGKSNIIDISMETGTGKTYTYVKTIFELNKLYGIYKFVVVVPTLPIKSGTVNFINSDSSIEHFKEQYLKTINLHVVESNKSRKNKKEYMPHAIREFVNSGNYEKDKIQVLLINAGMVNSKTMLQEFDTTLFDKYSIAFEAISATKPFMIIDEPHKFSQGKKTWENIQRMNPQFILRYGATFTEYENMIYQLTAVDSFNNNLIKGVKGYIPEFDEGNNLIIKFNNSDGKEANFYIIENQKKKSFRLIKGDSFVKISPLMQDVNIENLNKTTVTLSNGLELKNGDKINPYSYSETLQEDMIKKAVKSHFELEKDLLTRQVKIKPLTLFFIDNIEEYRNNDGYIRSTVEKYIKLEIEHLLKTVDCNDYLIYLEKTLKDISKTHAGYFAKDNSDKDELIEKEINEILHDKEAILDLDNPRRFIFSKWTLREGWDNPNVFQICKLRSSGSEISKLQEVGRGLRLPVNQYGNRVKDEKFYLNYFVDFTEKDFIETLVNEVNSKSKAFSKEDNYKELTKEMIEAICKIYNCTDEKLLEVLDANNVINRNNAFKEGGFDYIKNKYPLIFNGVNSSKIKKANDNKNKVRIRVEKYSELKLLWEKLNEKVILEYKFNNEKKFEDLFLGFVKLMGTENSKSHLISKKHQLDIVDGQAVLRESTVAYNTNKINYSTLKYGEFLKQLASELNVNIKTIHRALTKQSTNFNVDLNLSTIRKFKQNFNNYLLEHALNEFTIEYQKISSNIHPTKLTESDGSVKKSVDSADIGIHSDDNNVADNYLIEALLYDSELEKENMIEKIEEVTVFTKIPKNSIKIPVAGGKSYSPDFAYVLKYGDGKQVINLIVETKNSTNQQLRIEELQKIEHAKLFFKGEVKMEFVTQFSDEKISKLIRDTYQQHL